MGGIKMIEKIIHNYVELIGTEDFTKYKNTFANKIQEALSDAYSDERNEPDMVLIIEKVINKLNELPAYNGKFCINTKAIFIHGSKSQVEFKYYGNDVQRELGDLIFIISIVYDKKKYFEKFTISQFKKDSNNKKKISWNIENKEQLYLLSRFPSFKGISGSLISSKEYNLSSSSKCLGSYSLLYKPGDFAFIGAPHLDVYMGDKTSLKMDDIFKLKPNESENNYFTNLHVPFDWHYFEEIYYYLRKYGPFISSLFPIGFHSSSCYAPNINDFTDKYLRNYIGELTYSEFGRYNSCALTFLQELLTAAKKKAIRENNRDIINFIDGFFNFRYTNNDIFIPENIEFDGIGGNIGVIHTTINLNDGEI
jgi:hypothetical protein